MKPLLCSFVVLFCFCFCASLNSFAQARSLDGAWDFTVDRESKLTIQTLNSVNDWRKIRVPYSWNSQFEDLRDYQGVAWYRTRVPLQPLKADQTVLLKFGAVDYFAEVFINGQKAGEHEGGWLPFTIDAGKFVKAGENEIAVRVTDPGKDKERWGDQNFNELPHGKQSWYVQTGGIWQSVTLEVRPAFYIDGAHVVARTDGTVSARVFTQGLLPPPPTFGSRRKSKNNYVFEVRVVDPTGKVTRLEPDTEDHEIRGFHSRTYVGGSFKATIPNPKLWNPAQPNLYTLKIKIGKDRFVDRFGFRKFEARDGRLYLNGEPLYIISALDQDFYPDGIATPPSYEFLVDQMKKAKQLGLNMLRTHIKVPTPDYLRAADEVGLLIWYEVPSWDSNTWTPAAAKRGEEIFLNQLERDWNHPSIVIQSIINEAWGVRGLREAHTRKWLKEAFNRLQPEAARAGRLTVDNSACCKNFHLKSDLADFHQYYSIPDNYRKWDKWVAEFAARPAWLWSQHGDAEPNDKAPLLLSEFGNWGLPELPQQLPWWFERGFDSEVTQPKGVFDRFHAYKFDRLFAGFNDLARATQRHQWLSLKHEIEEIRRHASIQGYTITEFTDLNWECNGLLDMWRNKKRYADDLARLQQQDAVFARTDKYNYQAGETVTLNVSASHYSSSSIGQGVVQAEVREIDYADPRNTQVFWLTVNPESVRFDSLAQASVTALPVMKLKINRLLDRPKVLRIKLELLEFSKNPQRSLYSLIAQNYQEIFVYPKHQPQRGKLFLAGSLTKLADTLRSAGYNITASPEADSVILTDQLDAAMQNHLNAGRRVIVLATDEKALPADAKLKIIPRKGVLDGNWVTNFNWVNINRAPFKAVAFDKLLGFEAAQVMPELLIQGVKPEEYDDVMAGIFYGWINTNHALMTGARSGNGKLLLTTFRLADHYGGDEYATRLLEEMIRLTASDEFNPQLTLN